MNYKNNITPTGSLAFVYSDTDRKVLTPRIVNIPSIEIFGTYTFGDTAVNFPTQYEIVIYNDANLTTINQTKSYAFSSNNLELDSFGRIINYKFDLYNIALDLQLSNGLYYIVINVTQSIIPTNYIKIRDISADRTEVLLESIETQNSDNAEYLRTLTHLQNLQFVHENNVSSVIFNDNYNRTYELKTDDNTYHKIVNLNFTYNEATVALKLYEPLPRNIQKNNIVSIAKFITQPYVDSIYVNIQLNEDDNVIELYPNLDVDIYISEQETSTIESLDSLTANNSILVSEYDKINTDFSDYSNFIFFSTATGRLEGFVNKIIQIENIDTTINQFVQTSSIATQIESYENQKNQILQKFDEYENYLYTSTDSTAYPKISGSLYSVTSSVVQNWYNSQYETAKDYDLANSSKLINIIPENVFKNPYNSKYIKFVDMTGHALDEIYFILYERLKKHSYSKKSYPNNVQISTISEMLGWKLYGSDKIELLNSWKNNLDTDVSESNIYEIWKRILKTIPFIYKMKGTRKSLEMIMNCYGIPSEFISIKEFGGGIDNSALGLYNLDGFYNYTTNTKVLSFDSTDGSYIQTSWRKNDESLNGTDYIYPHTVHIRINPQQTFAVNTMTLMEKYSSVTQGLQTNPTWYINLSKTGSDLQNANLEFGIYDNNGYVTASIENIDIWNKWSDIYIIKQEKSNNINVSSSYTLGYRHTDTTTTNQVSQSVDILITSSLAQTSWLSNGQLCIGVPTSSYNASNNPFTGSIHNIKIYTDPLNDYSLETINYAPLSYSSNNYTSSYYDLASYFRLKNSINYNIVGATPIISDNPSFNENSTWNDNTQKQFILYNVTNSNINTITDIINIPVSNNFLLNNEGKIRIDDNTIIDNRLYLDIDTEQSKYKDTKDSNKIGVYLSPLTYINLDIMFQTGIVDIYSELGDGDLVTGYDNLTNIRNEYFKKFDGKNSLQRYLDVIANYDLSVLKQIDSVIPARANVIKGVVIEQNLLERPYVKMSPDFDFLQRNYNTNIDLISGTSIVGNASLFQNGEVYVTNNIVVASSYVTYNVNSNVTTYSYLGTQLISSDINTVPSGAYDNNLIITIS